MTTMYRNKSTRFGQENIDMCKSKWLELLEYYGKDEAQRENQPPPTAEELEKSFTSYIRLGDIEEVANE